ncbi:MAG: hypothetical protein Q9192_008233, partial [Flavoplaca navasiana]
VSHIPKEEQEQKIRERHERRFEIAQQSRNLEEIESLVEKVRHTVNERLDEGKKLEEDNRPEEEGKLEEEERHKMGERLEVLERTSREGRRAWLKMISNDTCEELAEKRHERWEAAIKKQLKLK